MSKIYRSKSLADPEKALRYRRARERFGKIRPGENQEAWEKRQDEASYLSSVDHEKYKKLIGIDDD